MIILGVDPGTAATGYGVIKVDDLPELIEYGCLRTSSEQELVERLKVIYHKIKAIVEKFSPDEIAVEDVFFNQNIKTALSVGQARGVILLAASFQGAKVFSYTPLEIKQAIAGYGRARKEQIQHMLKKILNLSFIPTPDDASDAIAVALCHFYSRKLKNKII
ncbi:MAG TPA: crossover junction endodeoxyribonuclease RuvC [Candidatus Aerophobetes bacterium]|uniref:Crossover junction endodeoxyribonuclease RuvC n=1 Tax=Aerophobetes bacterium TaxID=2030807 RepID=A0A7V5M020_UNCAE|nr:crossover junction endodeoxyribonuclease RuvC [Candidatus Aerophobetes bacterium]